MMLKLNFLRLDASAEGVYPSISEVISKHIDGEVRWKFGREVTNRPATLIDTEIGSQLEREMIKWLI